MIRRYNNSKQITALLGVALALLPSVQHLHLLCHLGGCATSFSTETACNEHGNLETKTCCHSHAHACTSTRETSFPSQQEDGIDEHSRSCPCPPDCWCHQAPQPFELPKCPLEPIEMLLQSIAQGDATNVTAIDFHPTLSYDRFSVFATSTESTVQRCAQLCRFLI